MRVIAIAAAVLAVTLVAGCGKHESKTTINTKDGSVTVSGNGDHMTMKANDGKTTVEINGNGLSNAKVPGFAPVYPNAQTQNSMVATTQGGGTYSFESTDSPDKIVAFYKDKAAAAGLAEKLSASESGNLTWAATSEGEKKTLQVIAAKTDSGSHVQVYWAEKQ